MIVNEFVGQLLAHMGVENVEINVTETDEQTLVSLIVDESDSGLLIGRHAETLGAIQKIVRLVCQKDGDKPIVININDFLERRNEHLEEVAMSVAERVAGTGQRQMLRLLPHERRIIHMVLKDHPSVTTESEGEGMDRVLFVIPKNTSEDLSA